MGLLNSTWALGCRRCWVQCVLGCILLESGHALELSLLGPPGYLVNALHRVLEEKAEHDHVHLGVRAKGERHQKVSEEGIGRIHFLD